MEINTNKKVIVCDLDGTLAESKSPLKADMGDLICKVLKKYRMAVISGAGFAQYQRQFLSHLSCHDGSLKNLHIFPVNGSAYYVYDESSPDKWRQIYMEEIPEADRKEIIKAFDIAIKESGVDVSSPYGELVEDRIGQVTFSGRGQQAPVDVKMAWDPDQVKRNKIITILKRYISEFEIRMGGGTSIDVTRKGITKAYAIGKIEEHLKVTKEDIVFIGDALYPGGNDESAKETGVDCISVSGPKETYDLLIHYLNA
jgi:phosphomannomutase